MSPSYWVDDRPVGAVARRRARTSERPGYFQVCLARALTALQRGEDLAGAAWSAEDPIRAAADIEALAGTRRLNNFRKDDEQ